MCPDPDINQSWDQHWDQSLRSQPTVFSRDPFVKTAFSLSIQHSKCLHFSLSQGILTRWIVDYPDSSDREEQAVLM